MKTDTNEAVAVRWVRCDECGRVVPRESAECGEDCAYCADCLPADDSDDGSPIHDYGYRPSPIFHGVAGQVHYGVELECSTSSDPRKTAAKTISLLGGREHVYLKSDGSIVGNGYEIV